MAEPPAGRRQASGGGRAARGESTMFPGKWPEACGVRRPEACGQKRAACPCRVRDAAPTHGAAARWAGLPHGTQSGSGLETETHLQGEH